MKTTKRIISIILCLILILGMSVTAFATDETLYLVAHRGYSKVAPENTLAAVKEAGLAHFYGSEFDIQPTADKVWAVMHNDTIDAMTDGTGAIKDMTYAQLLEYKIDAGNGLDKYPDEKIPTLEQMLDECKKYNLRPFVEIKAGDANDVVALCEYLKTRDDLSDMTIISFDGGALKIVKKYFPSVECFFLVSTITTDSIDFCKENGIEGIDYNYKKVTDVQVKMVQNAGLIAAAWTVDKQTMCAAIYSQGVNYMTTNAITPESIGTSSYNIPVYGYGAEEECTHICHQKGIKAFFWKIANLFNRIFKINKTCKCGEIHY